MSPFTDYIIFLVEGKKYGIPCTNFERVYRSIEITTLPNAPAVIQGIFNLHGEIIPVINIRIRFSIPGREINLTDKIMVLFFNQKRFAIVVDDILTIINNQKLLESKELYDGIDYVSGIIKNEDEIVIICNPEKLFQPDDEDFYKQSIQNLD